VRIERLRETFQVDARLVHFPLHPDTPSGGRTMVDLYAGRGLDPHQAWLQMKARMDAEGLPYAERTHTYNSRLAQELGCWADTQPGGDALHDALFRAYFVDRRNIAEPSVLVDLVSAAGLDVDEAGRVLNERRFADRVDADWRRAQEYGITGVPTFVAAGHGVVGAQPYQALERFVQDMGAARR
jgi:predicted DsbA family dithiol-disulfide isomerase